MKIASLILTTHARQSRLRITYTNYRGNVSTRTIAPLEVWFGSTEFHPNAQWLLRALDLDRNVVRDFAMDDMEVHSQDVDATTQEVGS